MYKVASAAPHGRVGKYRAAWEMERYGVVWVIVDGLSDVAPSSLGGRTPLQTAHMPTLDGLTKRGRGGLIDPVRAGVACGSDTAHLSMFGYNAEAVYRGRGAFETVGSGLSMNPGDVAFKCNLATMDADGRTVQKRCVSQSADFVHVARSLCKTINGARLPSFPDVKVAVHHAVGHRLAVSLRGIGLSDRISNTDPLSDHQPLLEVQPLIETPDAIRTAAIANEVSDEFRRLLQNHPLNIKRRNQGKPAADVVLLRGAAEQIELAPFSDIHGLHSFLIAPTKIIQGIGITAGIEIISPHGATGGYDTDLQSKARACVEKMSEFNQNGEYSYDMGIIHVKAVDEAVREKFCYTTLCGCERFCTNSRYLILQGHDRSVTKKVYWLEQVDIMVADLLQFFGKSSRNVMFMVITGDHTTAAEHGDHTCEPVPIVFVDISPLISNHVLSGTHTRTIIGADDCTSFDEINIGSNGSIGRFPGSEIMPTIRKLLQM